jgi:hypothetical protein
VFGSDGMSASNGDVLVSQNGWRRDDTSRNLFSLDLHSAKQDNDGMGKKPNSNAQALGSLGGKARARNLSDAEVAKIASKGGKARANKLSAVERSRIAKLAVAARERKREGGK